MRWFGIIFAVVVPVTLALVNVACNCGPSGPTNPDECSFRGEPGTEMRSLQLGFVPEPSDGMSSPGFVVYTPGETVYKLRGFQGADMLVTEMRVPADPADPTGTRCTRVRYQRSGEGSARYVVDMELVRQGDYWVTRRAIFDPTNDAGMMTLDVTLEDASFTATGSVSILLAGVR